MISMRKCKGKIKPSSQILKRFKNPPAINTEPQFLVWLLVQDPYALFKLPTSQIIIELGIAKKLLKKYPEFDFWRSLDMGDYFPSLKFVIKKESKWSEVLKEKYASFKSFNDLEKPKKTDILDYPKSISSELGNAYKSKNKFDFL